MNKLTVLSVTAIAILAGAEGSANQTIESMETLPPVVAEELEVDSTVANDVLDGAISVGTGDEAGGSRERQELAPLNLPPVGFVPNKERIKVRFDMVAAAASETDDWYEKAALAEQKKQYEEALKHIRRTLQLDPQHPHALLAEGRLLVKTQQYSAAKAVLMVLTDARTDDWRTWFWLGTSNLMLNELNAAEAALDEALARNSEVVEVWLHRALVEQQRHNWRIAMQLLAIADELAPQHPLVMLNAAMCREALGYPDQAARAYRKFLTQSHRDGVSRLLRFEVINHLSRAQLAAPETQLAREIEQVIEQPVSEAELPIAAGE